MGAKSQIAVCFVCLGNICRSPTAEGVMIKLVSDAGLQQRVRIDSAGTGAYHVGQLADPRSRSTAQARGIVLESRARLFVAEDFERFDYIVAMDRQNLAHMQRMAHGDAHRQKLALLRSFDEASAALDVPDPYYNDNFDEVFDICEAGCKGLLERVVEDLS